MIVADGLALADVAEAIADLESIGMTYALERADCGCCWTVIGFTNPLGAMLYRAHGLYPQN